MKLENFDEAKKLQGEIESKKFKIHHIDRLLKSCGLGCSIAGTPANGFSRLGEYVSYNTEFIKKLLNEDRGRLIIEVDELKEKFNSVGVNS